MKRSDSSNSSMSVLLRSKSDVCGRPCSKAAWYSVTDKPCACYYEDRVVW